MLTKIDLSWSVCHERNYKELLQEIVFYKHMQFAKYIVSRLQYFLHFFHHTFLVISCYVVQEMRKRCKKLATTVVRPALWSFNEP